MKQKDKLIKAIKGLEYEIGCISESVNDLTDNQVKKIINVLDYETTTFKMIIKGVKMLVEVESVDNEKDVTIKPLGYYS